MGDVKVRMRVGADAYALAATDVLEVDVLGDVAPLPGASSSVLGIRAHRGAVLPVFDLAAVLGSGPGAPRRVVVATCAGRVAGLAVDDVTDVDTLPDGRPDDGALVATSVVVDGRLVGVLDTPALFAALERQAAT